MKYFKLHQKIRVIAEVEGLSGKTGIVVRLLRRDDSAWVEMDEDIPVELRLFPGADPRCNHVNLLPEQCEELVSKEEP